jgi:hypothetical protein
MVVAEKTRDVLNVFDKFQGQSISTIDAEEIQNLQQEMIKNTFYQGFKRSKLSEPISIINKLINYLHKVDKGIFLKNPVIFQRKQQDLFHLIHTANLPDTDKMFYEYLIGLSRLMLSVQLLYGYVKYINNQFLQYEIKSYLSELFIHENVYSLDVFFNRMLALSNIGITLISYLSDYYFRDNYDADKYWNDVQQYFMQHKQLDVLARNLVSIHYVPENKRFLSMMQSIHWQGFGGSGDILLKYDQLKGLEIHSISHHENYNTFNSFNKRLLAFKLPLEHILGKTQDLIIEYLDFNFPTDVINIHDFCSGPRFIAIKAILEKAKKRTFNLTVSDVDGSSLLSLLNEKDRCHYDNLDKYEVRYEDLCLPIKVTKNQINKYHLVSVNLGLHQLPIEEIYTSIRHFSKITKIGGLISNLDASERRYLQLMIIPGNLVDREGHVPYVEQMDLNKLAFSIGDPGVVRIAYPLTYLSRRAMLHLDSNIGVGPYMVSFYTPVIITREDFDLLEKLWKLKDYRSCDKLIQKYLPHLSQYLS